MKSKRLLSVICAILCMVCLCIAPVYADTDGTEMNVTEASQLEIQLGPEWAGVEFQFKTDVGMYPNTIPVGDDGVLRLEIGGSSTYILSCLNSAVAIPEAPVEDTEAEAPPAETPATDDTAAETSVPDEGSDAEQAPLEQPDSEAPDAPDAEPDTDDDTVAGIPIKHIVIFGGGLLLAVGGLIAIKVVSKRREERVEYDDDYYEDEE